MDCTTKALKSKGDTYDIKHVFPVITKWNQRTLPTYKQVIGLVRNKVNSLRSYDNAITHVASQLHEHWIKCNLYPVSHKTTRIRVAKVIDEFRLISRTPDIKKGKTWQDKYQNLKENANKLFDIFNEDPEQIKKLEIQYGIPMLPTDYQFLELMRSNNKGMCQRKDHTNWHLEEEQNMKKKEKYLISQTNISDTVSSLILTDDSATDDEYHVDDTNYSIMQSDSICDETSKAKKKSKIL